MSDLRTEKRVSGLGNREIRALGTGRFCSSCFQKRRSELCDSNCDNCGIFYNSSDLDFRYDWGLDDTLSLHPLDAKRQGLCDWCGHLQWLVGYNISQLEDWLGSQFAHRSLVSGKNYNNAKQEIRESAEEFIDKGTASRENLLKVNITRQDKLFGEIDIQLKRYEELANDIEKNNEDIKKHNEIMKRKAEKEAQASDCFIATAAYGTKFEKKINVLRCWRDTKLMPSKVFSPFVIFYYRYSPPVARFISNKPFFQRLVRVILTPTIFLIGLVVRSEYPFWTDQGNPQ